MGGVNLDPRTDFARRITSLERLVTDLSSRDVLQNASIGANGLLVTAGGSITVQGGGSIVVNSGGSISLPSGTLSAGGLSISGSGSISGTLTVGAVSTGSLASSGNVSASGQVVSTGVINSPGTKSNTVTVGYSAVYIDSSGNMGGNTSSRRFKTNLAPAVYDLDAFLALPTWQFQRHTDVLEMGAAAAPWQSGLMAEDVAPVAPLNVWYDENGLVEGVRYEELVVPLLMIAKREYAGLVLARSRITTLESQVAALIAKVGLP
jgi:hypothetical protein